MLSLNFGNFEKKGYLSYYDCSFPLSFKRDATIKK